MKRPTLDQVLEEAELLGLLEMKAPSKATAPSDRDIDALKEVSAFYERTGRLPDPEADDHEEMRLGTIWESVKEDPSESLIKADRLGLLAHGGPARQLRSWKDAPSEEDIPASLDDIFADDLLDMDASLVAMKHSTPAAQRIVPDHRAEFVPCRDFGQFAVRFQEMQEQLDAGDREAMPIKKWAVIEPMEGDFFIRNGLLALIAEKSETSMRGGARDHRLRVIFSNGTESDPLMSSFRKSLNDDKTARMVQRPGLGPLDPEWESDNLNLSGTIYVARSLSEDPAIAPHRMILHKIGVTSQDVRRRVADARNDPTFLLAPVEIVATFELQNLPRRKVEDLLHRFFANARPQEIFVQDRFGKKIRPKEWFFVLPEHVAQAASLIKAGTLHEFEYDPESQTIIRR